MSVEISVIIPAYRDWHRLALCLGALARQTLPAGEFEVIVANNDATDLCPLEALEPNVRIIHEPKPGSYAARNAAVAASVGRYLAFTDSDCIPEPEWLENGLAELAAHPGARLTGPVKVFREPGSGYYAYMHDLHFDFLQREYVSRGTCVTANMMVSRELFDRIGGFEQRFSGGDFEWNRRAHAAGIPIVYSERLAVGHPARHRLSAIYRKKRRTAGSVPPEVETYRFVVARLKPPLRRLLMLRRNRVNWRDSIALFLILWLGRLIQAQELGLLRLGLRKPRRS